MSRESDDFDGAFPDFDPSRYQHMYPSLKDFSEPHWQIALQRVYDHELYLMARSSNIAEEYRKLARDAWAAIENNSFDAYACDLAGQLFDYAINEDDAGALTPMRVATYLSLMLWAGFREGGRSEWVQRVLHESISLLGDLEDSTLTVEQAFAAGWAAGRADGEFDK